MGGSYDMCVKHSLIGGGSDNVAYSGLLHHQITILTSPTLMSPYEPEYYPLEPKFQTSAIEFHNSDPYRWKDLKWPDFTLHPGERIYTKI